MSVDYQSAFLVLRWKACWELCVQLSSDRRDAVRIYKYFTDWKRSIGRCNSCKVQSRKSFHARHWKLFVLQNMNRSTTVLLRDLNEEDKSQENQGLPLSLLRQFSTKERGVARRRQTMTSILRRSISDSVERNLCYRVGLHQVLNNVMTKLGHENR